MTDAQIFRLFGIFYLCVSVEIFFNPVYFTKFIETLLNELVTIFLGGMVVVIIGYISSFIKI